MNIHSPSLEELFQSLGQILPHDRYTKHKNTPWRLCNPYNAYSPQLHRFSGTVVATDGQKVLLALSEKEGVVVYASSLTKWKGTETEIKVTKVKVVNKPKRTSQESLELAMEYL
jgi:hypothetical protein